MVHNLGFSTFPFIVTVDIARCMEDVVNNTKITFICIFILVIILYFLDTLKRCPDEYELTKLLADISSNWYRIGVSFKVHINTLNSIRNRENDDIIRLSEVINEWKKTQSSPFTWKTVILAVEEPIVNNKSKANEIREHLGLPVHNTE